MKKIVAFTVLLLFSSYCIGDDEVLIGHVGEGDNKKFSLLKEIEKMPSGWRVVSENDDVVKIAYWDKEHFSICSKKDAEIYGNKPVIWTSPSYSKTYYLLAYASIESKNTDEANMYINKALVLEPNNPMLLNEKGLILQHMGKHDAAVTSFDAVIESKGCVTSHERARALRGKGVSLIDLSRLEEAVKMFFESLEIEPDNKIAKNELNYIYDIISGGMANQPIDTVKSNGK